MRPLPKGVARAALWLLLALPAGLMLHGWMSGEGLAMDLIEPSGEMAIRLIVLALLPGPLTDAFGPNRLLRGWIAVRRNLGVAAFLYALLHLAFYAADMASLAGMIDEIGLPGIWTGWLALALLVPAAVTSTNRAMRFLGRRWKQVQFVVYPAALLTFIHWLLLEWSWQKALVHAAPLIIVWTLRTTMRRRLSDRSTS